MMTKPMIAAHVAKPFVGIKLPSSLSIIHFTVQIDEVLMPAFLPHQNQQNLTTDGTEFHRGKTKGVNRARTLFVVFPFWTERAQKCSSDLAPLPRRMFMFWHEPMLESFDLHSITPLHC